MSSKKNSDRFIVVIDQDKIEPDLARETVINFDPLNRAGKEGGFYIDDKEELHIDDDDVMAAHRMAIKKYPYDNAIRMVQLISEEEGEPLHQFGNNTFRLYGAPAPEKGNVVGILGENGIGKSTALNILTGDLKPNLGRYDEEVEWSEIKKRFRGTGLQQHFNKLAEGNVDAAVKPQQVERMPDAYDGKVRDLLEKVRDAQEESERKDLEALAEEFEVAKLMDRDLEELSGGELQRVAIASTALKDANLYVFDEPSSFLDVRQRLKMANKIRELSEDAAVLVVEHDLATLDLVSDRIHVFYGEPGSYGMVSNTMSAKDGINQYLEGMLESHNLRIRDEPISFDRSKRSQVEKKRAVMEYPRLEKDFGEGEFSLEIEEGEVHREEILGIFGENGLGKTVFAKMLAGVIEPDNTESLDISISFKPQYLEAKDETVREAISKHINPQNKRFEVRIAEPLGLEDLYDQDLEELSGGELQRVGVAICLAKDADIYLLDEPSAYMDVEARVELGKTLKRFARKTEKPLMVIDHDLMLLDYISDRGVVFSGEPGIKGTADSPERIENAMNEFLKEVSITYRKDPETNRPRGNKPGSQKDKQQRKSGQFYEQ
ncbi:ribosome biogenesis/translation initiation ATPase RLI [Candidatus Nanohalococcus occultus]|uniref:Translation initiation factor RLI1, contains Fe-S and AAA ATPase domains n=1 Tax=Candidatus Nanohalococcus occultus TaxID=2978047 RepID=A0ABY8CEL9_9ARCH|nr:Translation initiation factor RLI1, contains Fe-S and AAA ATPase domains [Candidatus Nanohaloarchaeota archaeon SVXNc]